MLEEHAVPVDVGVYATPPRKIKRVYVGLVLDKSGSMQVTKAAALANFNEQIESLKRRGGDGVDTLVTLVTFNDYVYLQYFNASLDSLQKLTDKDYVPEGSTALYDAVGYITEKFQRETDAENPENAYLLVLVTDGCENMSRHFARQRVKETLDRLQSTQRWTVLYMGCGHNVFDAVSAIGVPCSNSLSHSGSERGYKGAGKMSDEAYKRYFEGTRSGEVKTCNIVSKYTNEVTHVPDVEPVQADK